MGIREQGSMGVREKRVLPSAFAPGSVKTHNRDRRGHNY